MESSINSKSLMPSLLHSDDLPSETRPYGTVTVFSGDEELLTHFRLVRAIFQPGTITRGHYHLYSEEAYYVLRGSAMMEVWHHETPWARTEYCLAGGDYLTIPPGYVHRVRNTSDKDCACLVASSPPFRLTDQVFPSQK